LALQASVARATDPSPCPSPAASSAARVSCPAPVDPNDAAYEQLKTRLGGDIANALTAEHRLATTLDNFAAIEQSLSAEVAQEEALIAELEAEIARLDAEISDRSEERRVGKECRWRWSAV